ncbi:MAG: Gx transporter family protein [Desulfobacteraceae bacterium]
MQDSSNNKTKVALFVALACVLQISESLIPHPVPGLRLGLANILTLTAMIMLGFRYALEITILRTILSSFIIGTFMSPGFILSFSGAVISTLIMGFFFHVSGLKGRHGLSIIGISVIGAFSHNMIQLLLAYLILVRHSGIFIFFPWMSIGAVVMGYLVGIVARGVCQNLERLDSYHGHEVIRSHTPSQLKSQYVSGHSYLHRLPGHMKLIPLITLSFAVLITDSYRIYFILFICLAAAAVISHTPLSYLFTKMKQYSSLILFSFLLPVFFNSGSHSMVTIAHFNITHEGLTTGVIFASRIVLLILASALLVRTTSPEELTKGLALILSPLKHTGISVQRIAEILSMSWTAIPVLGETVRGTIFAADFKKTKTYRELFLLLSNLITSLYLETEKNGEHFKND